MRAAGNSAGILSFGSCKMSHAFPHHPKIPMMRLLRMLPSLRIVIPMIWGSNNLFNTEYYLACNPDVANSKIHPLLHFLIFGGFEGRKPNPLFDSEFYLRQYPDVARAAANPLLHYLRRGAAEGRKPHPLFEPESEGGNSGDGSLQEFLDALDAPSESVLYRWWMRLESRVTPPRLSSLPRFSLLLSLCRPKYEWLEEAIASVRAQTYPNWELCVSTNGCNPDWLRDYITLATESEPRIRVLWNGRAASVSVSLNQAAGVAKGDYLAVMGEEDRLAPDALHWLATKAPADLIYSDEDRLDAEGKRAQPLFKPGWSPELLLSCMYIGRIMAVSRAIWQNTGGFRSEHECAREHDLALRAAENAAKIEHVPHILYSRRTEAAVGSGAYDRPLPQTKSGPAALVSVIVCSRSPNLLERCLASLESRTSYSCRELVVIQHLEAKEEDSQALQAIIARYGGVRVPYSGPFHFSRMNNLAARKARGAILVFLNDDTEALDSSWLDRLVAHVERPDLAIAGARLLYPSGTLQHGGVALGTRGACVHIGRNTSQAVPHWPWLNFTRDVSAVTGACLAIRTEVFLRLGGFDEIFPVNYNDLDLCLRARKAGYRVIYEAGAILRHYECQTRRGIVTPEERTRWYNRWAEVVQAGDPFYNPNLTQEHEDLSLGCPTEH